MCLGGGPLCPPTEKALKYSKWLKIVIALQALFGCLMFAASDVMTGLYVLVSCCVGFMGIKNPEGFELSKIFCYILITGYLCIQNIIKTCLLVGGTMANATALTYGAYIGTVPVFITGVVIAYWIHEEIRNRINEQVSGLGDHDDIMLRLEPIDLEYQPTPTPTPKSSTSKQQKLARNRRQLRMLYAMCNRDKLSQVDDILASHKNKERTLWKRLQKKYGRSSIEEAKRRAEVEEEEEDNVRVLLHRQDEMKELHAQEEKENKYGRSKVEEAKARAAQASLNEKEISEGLHVDAMLPTCPTRWSIDTVGHWLAGIELGMHCDSFRQHAIDGFMLFDLSDDDLSMLGMRSVFHCRKFLKARANLQGEVPGDIAPLPSAPPPPYRLDVPI